MLPWRVVRIPLAMLTLLCFILAACGPDQARSAPQTPHRIREFTPPPGAMRTVDGQGTFSQYLRDLPLAPAGTPVLRFDGTPKARQDVHAAVIDMSVGHKDLQQCADAVIRLRAEYLFGSGRQEAIAFDLTNGFRAEWKRWRTGERIKVTGNRTAWQRTAQPDGSHEQFLKYLETVFMYAGTISLSRELHAAQDKPIEVGDVFIQGGGPGHAVIVVDVARTPEGRSYFLLAQSYMPAQSIHVLRNLARPELGPWFELDAGDHLRTPEWTFLWTDRKRW